METKSSKSKTCENKISEIAHRSVQQRLGLNYINGYLK